MIGASAGASLSFIWDADTVMDLEKDTDVIGGSGGNIGFDLINLNNSDDFGGFSFFGGVGAGFDIHVYKPATKTLWTNMNTLDTDVSGYVGQSTNKTSNTVCCRGCGRPIGDKPWQCHSGWTY